MPRDSYMVMPSEVTMVGTLPKGLRARYSGVYELFSYIHTSNLVSCRPTFCSLLGMSTVMRS